MSIICLFFILVILCSRRIKLHLFLIFSTIKNSSFRLVNMQIKIQLAFVFPQIFFIFQEDLFDLLLNFRANLVFHITKISRSRSRKWRSGQKPTNLIFRFMKTLIWVAKMGNYRVIGVFPGLICFTNNGSHHWNSGIFGIVKVQSSKAAIKGTKIVYLI